MKRGQLQFRYWTCQFSSYDKNELENHIDIKHAVDESFIDPSSSEEWECPECDQLFMADQTFARHVYKEHFTVLPVPIVTNTCLV